MLGHNLDKGANQIESQQTEQPQLDLNGLSGSASDNLATSPAEENPLALLLSHLIEQHQNRGELERLNQQLQASEARFQSLVLKNADAMIILDRHGIVRFANPAAQRLFKRSFAELIGQEFFAQLIAGSKSAIATEILPALCESDSADIQMVQTQIVEIICGSTKAETPQKSVLKAQMQVVETDWEGQIAHLATLRDISEGRPSEQVMQLSDSVLKAQQEACADGILVTGKNYKVISHNQRFKQLWCIPDAVLAAGENHRLFHSLFSSLQQPQEFIAKMEYLDAHPAQTSRDEIYLKDGRIFERSSMPAWSSEDKAAGRIWYFRDISERKQAEEQTLEATSFLRQSEELFRTLFEKAPVGIAIADLKEGHILKSNVALQQMLGYSASELQSMTFSQFTHPDDVATDMAHHRQMVAGRREHFQLEKRYICKNGQVIWSRLSASLAHDTQGNPQFSIGIIENITERKQAIEALRHSEARFQKLAANLPGAIYQFLLRTDGSVAFPYISRGCTELCELTPEEIQQNAMAMIERIHPEDRQQFEASVALSAQTLQPWTWEGRFILPSSQGKPGSAVCKWVQGASRPERTPAGDILWDGLLVDITERKQAEETLLRVTQAVESSSDAIAIADATGTPIYHNRAFLELFEYSVEEIIAAGGPPALYANPADAEAVLSSLYAGLCWSGELTMQRRTGKTIQISLRANAIANKAGQIVGLIGIHTDIGERKRSELALRLSESQLRQQTQQLEHALNELKQTQSQLIQTEKMSGLGQMVAGIAHEINNPVSFIYGNVSHAGEYIQDLLGLLLLYQQHYPESPPAIQAHEEAIDLEFLTHDLPSLLLSMKVGAERIRDLVLSLRNFSRLDEAKKKPVNIHEGIDSTLLILQNRLKAKQDYPEIQVIKEYGDLPFVECHAGSLNQVFMNLLANAIDALENQPAPRIITIHTSLSSETSRLNSESKENDSVLETQDSRRLKTQEDSISSRSAFIRITDNGPGIAPSHQSKLFDPFFTTKPVGKGTGLGLSISYQIVVEKHNGNLQCFSQPGQGTEFLIEIPIPWKKVQQTSTL